ncbi:hypothetical protein AB6A40_008265 [Gnathostoma spinigerum]|uniref:Uncharacterized protein n=1 Tax=Gnathostoma spinigerum TaxID=75299 RepID=A0ABD6EQI4_9BILA
MGLFDTKYCTEEQLNRLGKYKYKLVMSCPFDTIIGEPIYDWSLQWVPIWMAPNVLTILGFLAAFIRLLILSYYDYTHEANSYVGSPYAIPNWFWLFASFSAVLTAIFDGVDGKQARRIGAAGHVGEILDHTLDELSNLSLISTLFAIFGRGEYGISPFRLLLILVCTNFAFIGSQWEKFNTGVFFVSWSYDFANYTFINANHALLRRRTEDITCNSF